MKSARLLLVFLLSACSSTQSPTPEQIAAYGTLIHNGIQDYKAIKEVK